MAVLGPNSAIDLRALESDTVGSASTGSSPRPVHIVPMLDLEWRRAVEPTGPVGAARRPAHARRAWIHRAPESQVLQLFNSVRTVTSEPPAPWWLRALATGQLQSRLGGFAVEDQVAEILTSRHGWEYVPWTGPGEDGYWEYGPSETRAGMHMTPTTLTFTDRHPGWLDVIPAHTGAPPTSLPIAGIGELRDRLEELENLT